MSLTEVGVGGHTPPGIQLKYMKFNSVVKHLTGMWSYCHPSIFLFLLALPFPQENQRFFWFMGVSQDYHSLGSTHSVRLAARVFHNLAKHQPPRPNSSAPGSTSFQVLWPRGEGVNGAPGWQEIPSGCCHGNLLLNEIPVWVTEWPPCRANFTFMCSFIQFIQ